MYKIMDKKQNVTQQQTATTELRQANSGCGGVKVVWRRHSPF